MKHAEFNSIPHRPPFSVLNLFQKVVPIFILLTLTCVFPSQAEEVDFSVNIGLETRGFFQDPLFLTQGKGLQPSLFVEPEWQWRSDDRNHRFNAVLFARWDEQDSERSHADIRELYWSYNNQGWTTTVGINKVFWGVTESNHLVDVINQTDLVEDMDQEDKLGQPMIHISKQQDWGRLELFVLPYFRERTFAGVDGRFGLGQKISDNPVYESSAAQTHTDLALRYSHYFGDLDIGLHLFRGTDREPLLNTLPIPENGDTYLVPYYQQMNQFGVDLQYTTDAWLWKLEAIYRDTRIDQFWAAVGGFEYTFYQINDSDADLGLLIEYQHDGRNRYSAPTTADHDLFVAARFALNDNKDTAILGGFSYDIESHSIFYNIEAETRINDYLTAELRVRALSHVDSGDNAFIFNRNDYVQINLNWYF